MTEFKRATRKGTFTLIGLTGFPGSGKTYSAIKLARGLVGPKGKIAMIDTEHHRGSIYASMTEYDVADLEAPFSPARYVQLIEKAVEAKYNALIIDSASHEWEGSGGVLEMADATGKKGLLRWMKPKTEHKKFMNQILQNPIHMILCLRGKEKLKQVRNPKDGKDQIISEGIVPITEDRVLFEMMISLIMSPETHAPTIRKCPEELLHLFPDGQKITEKTGAEIRKWLSGAQAIDHDLEKLKAAARDCASIGTEHLRMFWEQLEIKDKKKLAPIKEDLKKIAAQADDLRQDDEGESESSQDDGLGFDDDYPADKDVDDEELHQTPENHDERDESDFLGAG